jgi:tight adherence protein B
MTPWLIYISVFAGVAAVVAAVAMMFRGDQDAEVEQRLVDMTSLKKKGLVKSTKDVELLSQLTDNDNSFERWVARHLNLKIIFAQADVSYTVSQFILACGVAAAVGFFAPTLCGLPLKFAPFISATIAAMPFMWLLMKRKRRLKKFAGQLPQALELIARALRAGHSLAAGMHLVTSEMNNPIAKEFSRTYEEHNLGTPMEEALENLTERVPNLDLKFFATAIILQRQTGGDLAEILDKIGHLIRERFQIWGQVQALTGEGRLSGIVLLALPPALFACVYKMNPDYLMLLFTDDLGKKMLIGGLFSQLVGALVIRKIVNIRV